MIRQALLSLGVMALLTSVFIVCSGCASFRTLGKNLQFMEHSSIVIVQLNNAKDYNNIKGVIVEYDPQSDRHAPQILSTDFTNIKDLGLFAFFVTSPNNQYVMAYNDQNKNHRYDAGEPSWINSNTQGEPKPIRFDTKIHKAKLVGHLSQSTQIPSHLMGDLKQFKHGRSRDAMISKLTIPIALGDIANL